MIVRIPEETKGFKLLGHDPSAAWSGGSKRGLVRGPLIASPLLPAAECQILRVISEATILIA